MADRARDPAALSAIRIARAEYIRLERALRKHGLDAEVIESHARDFTRQNVVTEQAYVPTAVALGCPLPAETTKRLQRVARLVDRSLGGEALAYVPSEAYHVTVANRAHYEHSTPASITSDEFEVIRDCIRRLGLGQIEVVTYGLMITAHGKLFLKGLPVDDRLLALRRALVEAVPALAINLPKTAHMKLAHLRPGYSGTVAQLQSLFKHLDDHVVDKIVFRDVYTPLGRIPLQEVP